MDPAFKRQREHDAAEPGMDPRRRLKKLHTRFHSLEREEAAWALHDALEHLFAAAEGLVELGADNADAAEALDHICAAIADLLDGAQ